MTSSYKFPIYLPKVSPCSGSVEPCLLPYSGSVQPCGPIIGSAQNCRLPWLYSGSIQPCWLTCSGSAQNCWFPGLQWLNADLLAPCRGLTLPWLVFKFYQFSYILVILTVSECMVCSWKKWLNASKHGLITISRPRPYNVSRTPKKTLVPTTNTCVFAD